jgi:type IV pilus assembly protein PilW
MNESFAKSPAAHCGFSLPELLVAMAISMVLLAALGGIFAQSVGTREKIDREGQKIEAARYSIDTMTDDIRLAGYFGNYVPPATGAAPADWKWVSPCSTTGGNPLPGWNPTASPVQVPFPIFGYEAHGTGALPNTSLISCLDNYKTGTDVLVIRRASTTTVPVGGAGYVSGETYLQVSSCPDATLDTQPFNAIATSTSADFNLHVLGCASATFARVRKLITRIYFISNCDDCTHDLDNDASTTGDGVPTLKMVELAINGGVLKVRENVRTIARGVENMHMEYGVDDKGIAWASGVAVAAGDIRYNGSRCYTAAAAGTTGATPPTHTSGVASDGAVVWSHTGLTSANVCRPPDGAVDKYIVSANNPCRNSCGGYTSTDTDYFVDLDVDAAGDYRWEDVVAVKLFLITRDLKSTTGYSDTKSYVMGTKTIGAAGDSYRRRLTSTVVKLVDMAGRREK